MQINGHLPQPALTQTERSENERTVTRDGAASQSASATDDVSLSSDAELIARVVKEATESPETRRERVEQARLKLESGELGRDTSQLAESIIDHLVE
jgi:flagellar biosynthesis anti-sigma factor FlgM